MAEPSNTSHSSLYPHTHDAKAQVYVDKEGRYWVSHQELLEYYQGIEDFAIVYLNGKFYELQGYAKVPDAWWMEAVDGETSFIPPEA